jgi:hypothetical protein
MPNIKEIVCLKSSLFHPKFLLLIEVLKNNRTFVRMFDLV